MKFLIVLLFVPFLTFASDKSSCRDLVNDCEYYSCIAAAKHCDNNSYPTQYGRKFCLRYGQGLDKFSREGRRWVVNVRKCLMNEMEKFEESLTCGDLKVKAFRSHVNCYVDHGFCELSLRDKQQIMTTIWPGLLSVLAIENGLGVLNSCYVSKL